MGDVTAKINDTVNEKVDKIVKDVHQKMDVIVQEKQIIVEEKLSQLDSSVKDCCVVF
jgi:hypothetical protein